MGEKVGELLGAGVEGGGAEPGAPPAACGGAVGSKNWVPASGGPEQGQQGGDGGRDGGPRGAGGNHSKGLEAVRGGEHQLWADRKVAAAVEEEGGGRGEEGWEVGRGA
jgi:hypothetical protein